MLIGVYRCLYVVTGVCRCLQVLIGAYMDIDRCLKVLKVPTDAYRCLQVGTGGHRWHVLGDLQICHFYNVSKAENLFRIHARLECF